MTEPAISVKNLSKRYRLGAISRRTLADEITFYYHKIRGRNASEYMGKVASTGNTFPAHQNRLQEFWALRNVSFNIEPGEITGIIGGNGAGKSTLLKILSRITEPTEGEAFINGRVGSLLEVGTGFHPELTGRENIYMSGTIQGMKRSEINERFDQIVEFSEISQFLDTPVKRYSSGMFVRLAFSVAAHLNPEILIIDEVLAVGDAAFQKKCLGKMGDVAREGRTILFVSHNMTAVENLCTRALWLDHGQLRLEGNTDTVVEQYLSAIHDVSRQTPLRLRTDRRGTNKAILTDFFITDKDGIRQAILRPGNAYTFTLECESKIPGADLQGVGAAIALTDNRNEVVWLVNTHFSHDTQILKPGINRIECSVQDFNLAEGLYSASFWLHRGQLEQLDYLPNAVEIAVEGGDFFGTGSKGNPALCKTLTRSAWRTTHP